MEYEIELRILLRIKYNFPLNVRLVLVIFLADYMPKGGKLEILCIHGIKLKNVGLKSDTSINCHFFFQLKYKRLNKNTNVFNKN